MAHPALSMALAGILVLLGLALWCEVGGPSDVQPHWRGKATIGAGIAWAFAAVAFILGLRGSGRPRKPMDRGGHPD